MTPIGTAIKNQPDVSIYKPLYRLKPVKANIDTTGWSNELTNKRIGSAYGRF